MTDIIATMECEFTNYVMFAKQQVGMTQTLETEFNNTAQNPVILDTIGLWAPLVFTRSSNHPLPARCLLRVIPPTILFPIRGLLRAIPPTILFPARGLLRAIDRHHLSPSSCALAFLLNASSRCQRKCACAWRCGICLYLKPNLKFAG
jgi:hypothetical protein